MTISKLGGRDQISKRKIYIYPKDLPMGRRMPFSGAMANLICRRLFYSGDSVHHKQLQKQKPSAHSPLFSFLKNNNTQISRFMNRVFTCLILSLIATAGVGQTRHVITNSGFLYSPADLNANVGDTVVFNLGGNHNALEVSETTWNNNGATSNNGFSVPFGGGSIVLTTAGTLYYVCEPHAGLAMKGKINVTGATNSIDRSFASRFQVTVTQNPLNPEGVLKIVSPAAAAGRYTLSDVSGRVLAEKSIQLAGGDNVFMVSFPPVSAGVLLLQVTVDGEPLPASRILRQ